MNDYTKTPNYSLYKPTPNADDDVWGDHLNANADTLDALLKRIDQRGDGSNTILVSDYLPLGQPDGITDVTLYLQDAIDAAAGVVPSNPSMGITDADRANAPGLSRVIFPANLAPYMHAGLSVPSNSHVIVETGATLKLMAGCSAYCLGIAKPGPGVTTSNVLIELYGTLNGNGTVAGFPSGGIGSNGSGPNANIYVRGSNLGLITNFKNWPINISCCTNGEINGVTIDNTGQAPGAGSCEFNGHTTNIAFNSVTGGTYTDPVCTITTAQPHGLTTSSVFALTGAAGITAGLGHFPQFVPTAVTSNTITFNAGAGLSGLTFNGAQVHALSGTYSLSTGNTTITTLQPHGLVPGNSFTLVNTYSNLTAANTQFVGQFTATAGTVGTTLNYTDPQTGKTPGTFAQGILGVLNPSQNVGFVDCTVRNINDLGVVFYGGVNRGYIRNCDISGCSGGGAMVFADTANRGPSYDCEISNNELWNNGAAGAFIGSNIFGIQHQDTSITGNHIFGNGRLGVTANSADGVLIADNYIHENGNVATSGPTGEITLASAVRVKVSDNVIFNPQQGRTDSNGYGIYFDANCDYLHISNNRIGDYRTAPSMFAAIGGQWGLSGLCDGNYYGPRINAAGYFPADTSIYGNAGSRLGINYDIVTRWTSSTTPTQPITNGLPGRGLSIGWNNAVVPGTTITGLGEVDFYVGDGIGSPGGFSFFQVMPTILIASGTYDNVTGAVSLMTTAPHGVAVGGWFQVFGPKGTTTDGLGVEVLAIGGDWQAAAGTAGTVLNYVTAPGLNILTIVGGGTVITSLNEVPGVVNTSVGIGGSLFASDGFGNARLSGALVHGAIQTGTLTNAGTLVVPQNTSFMLVQNSGSLASGTISMPSPMASSYQTIGSELTLRFQNAVGSLTFTGAAVAGPPTTVLSAGAAFRFIQGGPGGAANTWLPCIPDVSGTPPVGGPYLPVSGGAVTGALTVNGMSTHTAGLTVSGGGSVAGTFSGTPTWSGAHTFSGGLTAGASPAPITISSGNIAVASGQNFILSMGGNTKTLTIAGTGGTGNLAVLTANSTTGNTADFTLSQLLGKYLALQGTQTFSGSQQSGVGINPFYQNNSFTGTTSAAPWLNTFTITSDTVSAGGPVIGFNFTHQTATGATGGGRIGMQVTLSQNSATTGVATQVASTIVAKSSSSAGGTNTTTGSVGGMTALNPTATLLSGATNYFRAAALEANVAIATGASAGNKIILQGTNASNDTVKAANTNAMLLLSSAHNQTGVSVVGFDYGIQFGIGSQQFPMDPATGTMMGVVLDNAQGQYVLQSKPPASVWGIDFSLVKFGSGFLRSLGLLVDGTGQIWTGAGVLGPTASGVQIDVPNQTVTGIAVSNPGTPTVSAGASSGNYWPGDQLRGPSGRSMHTVTTTQIVSAAVTAGGSGGTAGTQTVTGTTGTGTRFQASVTVAAGAITAVNSISLAGSYTVNPSNVNAEPVTGAGLTGATLAIGVGIATLTINVPDVAAAGATTYPNPVALVGQSGVGATATLTWATQNTLALQSTAGGKITMPALRASTSYANDAAAATGGVGIGQLYLNGSAIQIRVT